MRSQALRAMTSAFLGTMPCQPLIGRPNQLGTIGHGGSPTKSIGKNIICKANQTWNQVKSKHSKGTDSNLAKGISSFGMPMAFLAACSCVRAIHFIPIHSAVPMKTTKMKALKAWRRMNSTRGP